MSRLALANTTGSVHGLRAVRGVAPKEDEVMGLWKLPGATIELAIGAVIVMLHLMLASRLDRPHGERRERLPVSE